jgi:4-hydroxy-tetrahydrodipicolinate synthase
MNNGIYAASLTPLRADDQCAYQELADHCQNLLTRGCEGILIFGTTGEGPSFSLEERKKALKALIDLGVDPKRLLLGNSFSALEDAVELTRYALSLNCSTMLLSPPFFFKNVRDSGVLAFYREFIKRVAHSDLKILLYHIPSYTAVPISIEVIEALRQEFPQTVVGIKESSGDLSFTKQILAQFPGFKVFVGNEVQITEAVQAGAAGGINGLANIFPEMVCSLYNFGRDPSQPDANEEMQKIVRVLKNYPILPAIKCLAWKVKGPSWHLLRAPLLPLDHKQKEQLIQQIARLAKLDAVTLEKSV